ncbi:aspartate aminotransferase family protein [Sinorhizobium medicae]|uniref:Aspartate aminotransferase family protein n=1 Tax=Sinorhizobium medicae TaxID=110321 RepID=A0ABX4TTJ8_9HYPH|nr:aspartate aminotransferase family protein [Sinorhizobium medicae]MDX0694595.1 aminotransferase class III-fold pyridoxal phosphate-dependent enzyme [Sinorhizobium medicae]MDX0743778.1 aminotransferase class III-fold pyridoxal phosphate-dependent enzyme [Sinorhizobium medicae]MDX0771784.1 aminotransferase class III-fold pyridoxal phosphate-dependent enzyme [Sinorhizobium medicae]MDX0906659.1 aminotransferase class III-fold pyridoxal phosphate-dependent enzyme [Sinorhizobium medicae]MDX1164259
MSGLYARESRSISSMAHLRFFPQAVVGGSGAYLTADDGRRLLDFSASWGAASLGHSHPAIREAVDRALSDQAGASYLSTANEPCVLLAEKLLSLVPERARGRVWFGHSGSDANETVARMVVAATGRPRILAFEGAYHGGTVGSMGISGHPAQQGGRAEGLTLVPYPNSYAAGSPEAAKDAALARLQQLFATELPPGEVAAFFIEPIQSDGGMLVPPDGFFKAVEALCRKHGILIVSDEVKVGLGRSGRFSAFEQSGIEPDIIVFGKGLGGGLPISAVVGPEAVMNHAVAFSLQTVHGNPICAAAALAVLQTIERNSLAENAEGTGGVLRESLDRLAARHRLIGDVRGRGLALGVELVEDHTSRKPASRQTALTVYRAFQLGLVLYYVGVRSNVLELTPPLTLTQAEAREGVAILDQALEDVAAGRIDDAVLEDFAGW